MTVQDSERKMASEHKEMKAKFDEMVIENKKCTDLAAKTSAEIKEVQAENARLADESAKISANLIDITAESAYFKDLLEKGLTIRKELEQKLADEKSTKSKANDEKNEAKTTLDRLQDEFEINRQKLEERQKELDQAKSNAVALENQIETLNNEVTVF